MDGGLKEYLSKTALNARWMGLRVRPVSALARPGVVEAAATPAPGLRALIARKSAETQIGLVGLLDRITGRKPGMMGAAAGLSAEDAGAAAERAAMIRGIAAGPAAPAGAAFPGGPAEVFVNAKALAGPDKAERRARLKALLRHEGSHAYGAPESAARVLGDGPGELGRWAAEMAGSADMRGMYDGGLFSLPWFSRLAARLLPKSARPGPGRRAAEELARDADPFTAALRRARAGGGDVSIVRGVYGPE